LIKLGNELSNGGNLKSAYISVSGGELVARHVAFLKTRLCYTKEEEKEISNGCLTTAERESLSSHLVVEGDEDTHEVVRPEPEGNCFSFTDRRSL